MDSPRPLGCPDPMPCGVDDPRDSRNFERLPAMTEFFGRPVQSPSEWNWSDRLHDVLWGSGVVTAD
jgi:hypothetical protein